MKRFGFRLAVAFITFFIGIAIATVWLVNRPSPVVQVSQTPLDCIPAYDPNIHPYEYGSEERANLFMPFRELPLETSPTCVEESYRLTWLPTFHSPTVIRVWRSDNKYFIVTKRLSGMGGYGFGYLNVEQTRSLTETEWHNFVNRLNQSSYWEIPSTIDEPMPMDGAAWMLEGLRGGNYHFVHRISPSEELSEIIRHLFNLTGIETEHESYLPTIPHGNSLERRRR